MCARSPAKGAGAPCSQREDKVTRAPPARNPPLPPNPGNNKRRGVKTSHVRMHQTPGLSLF